MKGQYIQIYTTSTLNPNQSLLIEACGSDSVIPLDGRLSLGSCIEIAIEHCRKNNIKGFRIMKKQNGNWGHMLTDCYHVTANTVLN